MNVNRQDYFAQNDSLANQVRATSLFVHLVTCSDVLTPSRTAMDSLLGLSNHTFKRSHIDPHLKSVLRACRDTNAHSDLKDLIPLGEILQDSLEVLEDETNFKDNLLPLLVNWFSSDFFKWFEQPDCERCASSLRFQKSYINPEHKLVESYVCDKDGYEFLFIRHNEPSILMHTRTGRCGEWAMCFFIILRSMDYHTRIVYDTTDHVWNEVWSETKNQYIHVDPCDNIVDSPLLYEVGWQKKLEYCIAMGQYEVQDVTKRYAKDYAATQIRRNKCDETWLSQCLDQITSELLSNVPTEDLKSTIIRRRKQDLEFIESLSRTVRKVPDQSQLSGRKTGSLQWRISRGEYHIKDKKAKIIKLTDNADVNQTPGIYLVYNCDKNIYHSSSPDYDGVSGWLSLVYEYENLDFKFERDWKTSYIARYEGCEHDKSGMVRWRFDLSDIKTSWQSIEILFTGRMYPETSMAITLLGYISEECPVAMTKNIELNDIFTLKKGELSSDIKYLDILAVIWGGIGNDGVAWQKPQLFRQTRGQDSDKPAFSFKIC